MDTPVPVVVDAWVAAYEELKSMLNKVGIRSDIIDKPRKLRHQIYVHERFFTGNDFKRSLSLMTVVSHHH
jgi:hypothetical protein